jgi:hypothetical protein
LERDLRDVCGGLDTENGDPARVKVLQQIAVVGRELNHTTVLAQPERVDHLLGITTAVLEPADRVGRVVGVVREDPVGRLELLELHEKAAAAYQRAQRIVRLHRAYALGRKIRIGQRRGAEVGEHVAERGPAEPARRGARLCAGGAGPLHSRAGAGWEVHTSAAARAYASICAEVTAAMSSPA